MEMKKNEATAALRRVYFQCVDATDGFTPETGEAGGQPQRSLNGAAWTNTSGVLVAIGNGRYYVELTQAESNQTHRSIIETRYKSAETQEALGSMVQIFDPMTDIVEGSTTLKQAIIDLTDAVLGDKVLDYSADTLTYLKRDGVSTLKVFDATENAAAAKSYTEIAGQ